MTDAAERIRETVELLAQAVADRAMPISADRRVREADAESLAGYAPGSFRTLRDLATGPPYFRVAVAGSRYSYRLEHLAEWLESRLETPSL